MSGWHVVVGAALILSLVVLGAALAREHAGRRRAERSLGERVRFEALLADEAATFSTVSAADVDREIERALRRIADFLEVDWGNLMEYSDDRRTARITHSWVAEGVDRQPSAPPVESLPWVARRIEEGQVVRFSRPEELPADSAAVDRRTFHAIGVKSQVAIPLVVEGAVMGALAFSTLRAERAWRDEFVQRLRLLGEVFANTLSRRRAEMERQRLRRDLAHVGRVSTMGELTASLAHELNQPLTSILSNAQAAEELLQADRPNLAEVREIVQDIVRADKRASEVIQRLRGLLRKGSVEPSSLDINELVDEVAGLASADAILRDVVIELELAPALPSIWGDRVQLQQVVLNLLLNGLDAMSEADGGARRLTLRTGAEGPDGVRVTVRDSGTGIDQVDLDRIFDPFYSTKATGMGMGLAIARSIIVAHRGRLEARNNPEGGATFSFVLPVSGSRR
ncbi:MAG TPA: ATP-binding protein [Methylomirabilota bacterium]|nr:ATP-binding protein [Methylomirabilota bacterium]